MECNELSDDLLGGKSIFERSKYHAPGKAAIREGRFQQKNTQNALTVSRHMLLVKSRSIAQPIEAIARCVIGLVIEIFPARSFKCPYGLKTGAWNDRCSSTRSDVYGKMTNLAKGRPPVPPPCPFCTTSGISRCILTVQISAPVSQQKRITPETNCGKVMLKRWSRSAAGNKNRRWLTRANL